MRLNIQGISRVGDWPQSDDGLEHDRDILGPDEVHSAHTIAVLAEWRSVRGLVHTVVAYPSYDGQDGARQWVTRAAVSDFLTLDPVFLSRELEG